MFTLWEYSLCVYVCACVRVWQAFCLSASPSLPAPPLVRFHMKRRNLLRAGGGATSTSGRTTDPVGCGSSPPPLDTHGEPRERGPGTHLIRVEIEVEIETGKRRGHDGEAMGRHYSTTVG